MARLFLRCSTAASKSAVLWAILFASSVQASDFDISISEIHYHPAVHDDAEFVELYNASEETVDLGGWFLVDGVQFLFPEGASVGPGEYLVVARDPALITQLYGVTDVEGGYTGRLSNSGERLTLLNGSGQLIDRVAYEDSGSWPGTPDGQGPSLERTDFVSDGEQQWVWRASIPIGGTPGAENSTLVSSQVEVLISEGDEWFYRKGNREPASPLGAWVRPEFDDSAWSTGPSGFGYGDGDDNTTFPDMRGNYSTIYLRKSITLPDPDQIDSLILNIAYDDAFVLYLNGDEIARSASAGGSDGVFLRFNARAADGHSASSGGDSTIELASEPSLVRGENVLAFHVLNVSINSSDLSLIPTMRLTSFNPGNYVEPAHDLEINEVLVSAEAGLGFVEFFNDSSMPIDASGWSLIDDPFASSGYEFPAGTVIQPRDWLVVPQDSLAFNLIEATPQWLGVVTQERYYVEGIVTNRRPSGLGWGRMPDGAGNEEVLDASTPGEANQFEPEVGVVIHEIRYHPPLGQDDEEFLELYNSRPEAVNLSGWSISGGVKFEFPAAVELPSEGFLVIARDPTAIEARYGITGVLGPWTGRLSNSSEKIELENALGNRVDVVNYADDGLWPGTPAQIGPDGFGASIELLNPAMENNAGVAWRASSGRGTPGLPNSRSDANPAPVLRSPNHSPSQPGSGDSVTVTVRAFDEEGLNSISVRWRKSGSGSFATSPLMDDGSNNDGLAGDGEFGAALPPQRNGTVVQFYISAIDASGQERRYPGNAPSRTLLYQVDDASYPAGRPLYRVVLTTADMNELSQRSVNSDVLLDGTFIRGDDVTYNVGVRLRGEHSRNFSQKGFRIQLSHDQPFEGIKRLNLIVEDIYKSVAATDVMRRAGQATFQSRTVSFTVNRNFDNKYGGLYQRVEAIDSDFLSRAFPGDDEGNLYRGRDFGGSEEANLSYRGPDPDDYVGIYEKKTNKSLADWTDIVALTDALNNTSNEEYVATISSVLDVSQWLRFFALQAVISNTDGAIATSSGEDYLIYRKPSDGRWVILPWDQNETFRNPGGGLFKMSSAAVQRLVQHPSFVRSYLSEVHRILEGPLDPDVMARRFDRMEDHFSSGLVTELRDFVNAQQVAIRELLPIRLTAGIDPFFLVRSGSPWKFFRGTREPSGGNTAWTTLGFNDSSWEDGLGGFGYGDGDDRTVLADMEDNYTTVYIRHEFDVPDPSAISDLSLGIRYDDGFVLYLNGVEVARRNVSGSVRFDERASGLHEADSTTLIDLSRFTNLLRTGRNVVAAVGVNESSGSSDLTLDPEIFAPADGTGCGDRLFTNSGLVSIGGEAPVLETVSVEVDGQLAEYEAKTGRWHADVVVPEGDVVVQVNALGAFGEVVATQTIEVASGNSLTRIGGSLSTRTLTRQNSPYFVTRDLSIAAGQTVTIEAGSVVYFDAAVSVVVRGALVVEGSAADPVLFAPATCEGIWGGVAFVGSSAEGDLRGLDMTGASVASVSGASQIAAVSLTGNARVNIDNSHFAHFEGPAIDADGSGAQLLVVDTLIEDTKEAIHSKDAYTVLDGVHIRDLYSKSDCVDFDGESNPQSVVRNCLLENGPDDGIDLGGSSALMEGNVIRNMSCKGLSLEGESRPEAILNLIVDCNDGIVCKDSVDAVIDRCTVVGTQIGLHFYEKNSGRGGGKARVESSIIWGNGRSVLLDGLSQLTLTYSDVGDGYTGVGNILVDPGFVSPSNEDFHLRPDSPAIGSGRGGVDMGAIPFGGVPVPTFIRGDFNTDGLVDVSDPIRVLLFLFEGAAAPRCPDAGDSNDDGSVDLSDSVYVLNFLFLGGPQPRAPYPNRGSDPTDDGMSCE